MKRVVDILIVGGGPAGLSAAVNAAARGKSCTVVSNALAHNPLYRAKQVDNYLGMRGMTGAAMLEALLLEAEEAGAVVMEGRVLSILPMGEDFMTAVGNEMVESRRVILCTGIAAGRTLAQEDRFVGRGVSYCATCDGMLYRGRRAVVTGDAADLAEEAAFLLEIGVLTTVITARAVSGLPEGMEAMTASAIALQGADRIEGVVADGRLFPCDVVFILREVMAPGSLVPGLQTDGRFIRVDADQQTNIPGLYAAGDCTGRPLQVAVAVGEGLVAAQHAARSLDGKS